MAKLLFMAVVVVLISTARLVTTEAQSTPSCASKLVNCYPYLSGATNPPANCCDPIKEAVRTELQCLCTLYTTPGLLQQFKVSLEQALNLSKACGVPTDLSACRSSAESPNSPPGVPGNDGVISARRMAWTGILSFILFWASIMQN